MAVRSYAAPPTPWAQGLAEPKIDKTAYIHSSSSIIGDVRVGANVLVAPGTFIRADEGKPFYIGAGTNVQDGVVIHGLEQGRVTGDDENSYSVWIGHDTSITHMALIHGPAYVGDNCFIGFRSTVFNSRVGDGCIVMMHCLIEDVEIPAGKYVPSGSIITSQDQADRLSDVQAGDTAFAEHVVGINDALRSGYHCAADDACITPLRVQNNQKTSHNQSSNQPITVEIVTGMNTNSTTSDVATQVLEQIRQLLAQGYKIGTEHADDRRFRTSSWTSCVPFQSNREAEVIAELESCLAEHSGDYIRLIGIDTKAKRRVLEQIIQRPHEKIEFNTSALNSHNNSFSSASSRNHSSSHASVGISSDVGVTINQLLAQGNRVSVEWVDERRFKTGSWQTAGAITSVSELQQIAGEHQGDYVKIIGTDPKSKRRLVETIVQRPNGKFVSNSSPKSNGAGNYGAVTNSDASTQIHQLLAQGNRVTVEWVDERRFKTGSWQTAGAITSVSQLEQISNEHQGDYVKVIGTDPKSRRRLVETIVQRPNGKVSGASTTKAVGFGTITSTPNVHSSYSSTAHSSSSLSGDLAGQVNQLFAHGHRVTVECVDTRRFKTGSWQTAGVINAIAELDQIIQEHSGEYIRVIGTDTKSKRRVLELMVQRPAK